MKTELKKSKYVKDGMYHVECMKATSEGISYPKISLPGWLKKRKKDESNH